MVRETIIKTTKVKTEMVHKHKNDLSKITGTQQSNYQTNQDKNKESSKQSQKHFKWYCGNTQI